MDFHILFNCPYVHYLLNCFTSLQIAADLIRTNASVSRQEDAGQLFFFRGTEEHLDSVSGRHLWRVPGPSGHLLACHHQGHCPRLGQVSAPTCQPWTPVKSTKAWKQPTSADVALSPTKFGIRHVRKNKSKKVETYLNIWFLPAVFPPRLWWNAVSCSRNSAFLSSACDWERQVVQQSPSPCEATKKGFYHQAEPYEFHQHIGCILSCVPWLYCCTNFTSRYSKCAFIMRIKYSYKGN